MHASAFVNFLSSMSTSGNKSKAWAWEGKGYLPEALMPAVGIHDACKDIGLAVGVSPEILFVVKMDSQVTLTQLRNESVTTRSRPFAN